MNRHSYARSASRLGCIDHGTYRLVSAQAATACAHCGTAIKQWGQAFARRDKANGSLAPERYCKWACFEASTDVYVRDVSLPSGLLGLEAAR